MLNRFTDSLDSPALKNIIVQIIKFLNFSFTGSRFHFHSAQIPRAI